MWHVVDRGSGPPLVLLHGIGMSGFAFSPVLPLLEPRRRCLAFDLPGFGRTPPLPPDVAPTAANLAAALDGELDALGVTGTAEFAGNSLGGLVALEAAARGRASGVAALSPAGLWRAGADGPARRRLALMNLVRKVGLPFARRAVRSAWVRREFFAATVSPHAGRMLAADAVRVVEEFAAAADFRRTLHAVAAFEDGVAVRCPVAVAFGAGDLLLPPAEQRRDRLPPHARWCEPAGWGHVPTWDDPAGVADFLLAAADGPAAEDESG